ncbi:NADPH dehydrogenase-like [Paramacrobiotus metropolitanus]|uniref:NADPH dehydrogenase-like n=1 Tax=Paramacrobiotus metropolitanus TaxID=2943436 RepID=UPI002445F865|nr:NADPH dehydrogenase-like [Paramacrobiotus metropolitanus]
MAETGEGRVPCGQHTCIPKCMEPLKIRDITLKNRIVVSPMCQYSANDGFPNDWHLVHLGSRAIGGAGLLFFEATAVCPEGRISPEDLGIWKDEHIEPLVRIVKFIREQNCVAGIQIAHAGRKASHSAPWKGDTLIPVDRGGWVRVAPSAVPFKPSEPAPRAMTREDIQKAVEMFRAAAERALKAGFQVLEIHGAHGYLINEFLSPLSNKRTDEYGGSFENRIRLLLEVTEAVRTVWPDTLPLFVRLSATDWADDGWTKEDTVELAKVLKTKEVDLIDVTTGGIDPNPKIPVGPLYQVPFAEAVKKEAEMMTGAVGLINTPEEVESVIKEGRADLVFMARGFIRDPYFARRAAEVLGSPMEWMGQYQRTGTYMPRKDRQHILSK